MKLANFIRTLFLIAVTMAITACSADTTGVDFATLKRPSTPNTYLVCPPARCAEPADAEAPVYAVPPPALFELVRKALSAEPRTVLVQDQPDALRLVLVQRSLIFRFPDTITVQVFPQAEGSSTLAIYSRSNYGRSDLGVNKARVQRWLGLIAAQVAGQPGA
ncbi:MAG TPA: DUF1499 domain-containing protein [Methylomirabilota bacterium]|nr:DUF1499 domain-containing protein [Methylomirabilota bacterium]